MREVHVSDDIFDRVCQGRLVLPLLQVREQSRHELVSGGWSEGVPMTRHRHSSEVLTYQLPHLVQRVLQSCQPISN